jgi:hypothetical protein
MTILSEILTGGTVEDNIKPGTSRDGCKKIQNQDLQNMKHVY